MLMYQNQITAAVLKYYAVGILHRSPGAAVYNVQAYNGTVYLT